MWDRRVARGCFIAVILLGLSVAVLAEAWLAAVAAASVDHVLSPDELQDEKLIEVVYRTHHAIDSKILIPYRVAGTGLVLCSIVGLYALTNRKSESA
jgi:hypothetical protein